MYISDYFVSSFNHWKEYLTYSSSSPRALFILVNYSSTCYLKIVVKSDQSVIRKIATYKIPEIRKCTARPSRSHGGHEFTISLILDPWSWRGVSWERGVGGAWIGIGSERSVKRPLLWALARVIWSRTVEAKASLCAAPFPSCSSPDPSTTPPRPSLSLSFTVVACRFAPRRRRSCATQPAGRVGGPARVEFSPQAGQPNGNKKLRQTALPTPQRPVNIVAEREREKEGGRKRESVAESCAHNSGVHCSSSKDPLWIGYYPSTV